jgi:hypothetical protein
MITPDDRREISKANKRIERMFKYTNGDEETIDKLRNDLELIYGHDIIGVPKLKLSEVSGEDRDFLAELAKGYNASPYSTITSFKALATKGFSKFAKINNLNNDEVVKMSKLFRSPTWHKIRDEYNHASESVVDGVLEAVANGASVNEIKGALSSYLKSSDTEKSVLEFLNSIT